MVETPPDRKWALIRVSAGDYILPSNDRTRIWRIVRYIDGPSMDRSFGQSSRPWLWAVYDYLGGFDPDTWEWDNWDKWDRYDDGFETRREAIEVTLRARGGV